MHHARSFFSVLHFPGCSVHHTSAQPLLFPKPPAFFFPLGVNACGDSGYVFTRLTFLKMKPRAKRYFYRLPAFGTHLVQECLFAVNGGVGAEPCDGLLFFSVHFVSTSLLQIILRINQVSSVVQKFLQAVDLVQHRPLAGFGNDVFLLPLP